MINYKILKKYKTLSFKKLSRKKSKNFIFFILAGCGGNDEKSNLIIENSVTFVSPQISYGLENAGQLTDPYWLKAIQAEQTTPNGIINVLNSSGGNFKYTFPLLSITTSFQPGWFCSYLGSSVWVGSKSTINLFDKLGNLNVAVFEPSCSSTYGNV